MLFNSAYHLLLLILKISSFNLMSHTSNTDTFSAKNPLKCTTLRSLSSSVSECNNVMQNLHCLLGNKRRNKRVGVHAHLFCVRRTTLPNYTHHHIMWLSVNTIYQTLTPSVTVRRNYLKKTRGRHFILEF